MKDQKVEEISRKVVASLSIRMATHMEFETQLPDQLCARVIGVFRPYWKGDITYGQLIEALRLVGYGEDLDADGLHQFINHGDLH